MINPDVAASRVFPPLVRLSIVKIACERPDVCGRSLCLWDCQEIARELVKSGMVPGISVETVRKVLSDHRLKPWRYKMWLSGKVTRDAAFAARVLEICSLYTRPLAKNEKVLCLDENTSIQPRPRTAPTLAAKPEQPTRLEHEYERKGALNLLSGFDITTGEVYAKTARRKRQEEFIGYLEYLHSVIAPEFTTVHLVMDNVPMHKGKKVRAWLEKHPRFICHFPPVHCSWMNQVEQWFGILRRKRLRIVDFPSLEELEERLMAFVAEWNQHAHAFNWTYHSFEKILMKCDDALIRSAPIMVEVEKSKPSSSQSIPAPPHCSSSFHFQEVA